MITHTAKEIGKTFGLEYWREKEAKEEFASEFWNSVSSSAFRGIVIPANTVALSDNGAGYIPSNSTST